MIPHPPINLKTPLNIANWPSITCICASHNLALFNSCHVLYDLPSNTSDHCSLVAEIRSNVFCCPQQQKKRINIPCITGENFLRRKSQRVNSVTLPGIFNKLHELNPPTSPDNPLAIEEYLINIFTTMHAQVDLYMYVEDLRPSWSSFVYRQCQRQLLHESGYCYWHEKILVLSGHTIQQFTSGHTKLISCFWSTCGVIY